MKRPEDFKVNEAGLVAKRIEALKLKIEEELEKGFKKCILTSNGGAIDWGLCSRNGLGEEENSIIKDYCSKYSWECHIEIKEESWYSMTAKSENICYRAWLHLTPYKSGNYWNGFTGE